MSCLHRTNPKTQYGNFSSQMEFHSTDSSSRVMRPSCIPIRVHRSSRRQSSQASPSARWCFYIGKLFVIFTRLSSLSQSIDDVSVIGMIEFHVAAIFSFNCSTQQILHVPAKRAMLPARTCRVDCLIYAEKTRRLGLGDIVQRPQTVWDVAVRTRV